MKNCPTRITAMSLLLALGLCSTGLSAQPPEHRGKSEGHPGKHNQAEHSKGGGAEDHSKYKHEREDGYQREDRRDISIEEAALREIFRDQKAYIDADSSLPPGIRKNLARGKPLPPGIAKKFDNRVRSKLPDYPGYDWRQVGTDAVLIDATTGIVEAIIANALR